MKSNENKCNVKRSLFIILFVALLTQIGIPSLTLGQTVMIVKDNAKRRQLESMVFMRWNKKHFRPKWYYWLFHNRYRKGEDRRTLKQLLPAAGFVIANEEKAETQKEDTDEYGRQELWSYVNHIANTHYHLIFRLKFDRLSDEISAHIQEGKSLGIHTEVVQRLQQEKVRLEDEITIIKEGYLDEGKKSDMFIRIEKDMRELKGHITELLHLYKIQRKYEQAYERTY